MTRRRKGRRRVKLTPEQKRHRKEQRDHKKRIRAAFRLAGFLQITELADKRLIFKGSTSDIDDLFVYENVVVAAEYTAAQESDVSAHLKNKKIFFDKIHDHQSEFVNYLKDASGDLRKSLKRIYGSDHFRVFVLYCSRYQVKESIKADLPNVRFLDYNVVRYFESVARTVRNSSRYELFDFLRILPEEIGESVLQPPASSTDEFQGSILPEGFSNFGTGFKVLSFYITPAALLERCYVLRRHGWRPGISVYQRMISRKKIETVRRYLQEKQRVFVNNIIVTLPPDTKLLDEQRSTLNIANIKTTQPARIQLPKRYNSIGIIDGQHRVFSYHEGGFHDEEIEHLRKQQNLLVTGVVFPRNTSESDRSKFEATLFLEINSNQTNAKSDLKHEIGLMLRPFDADSIAKKVVTLLNDNAGPLRDQFERYFYDKDKIKTTSIVSFGVKPVVKLEAVDSLYVLWDHRYKARLLKQQDEELLDEYVSYCVDQINSLIAAARRRIDSDKWTASRKIEGRFLTTTNINGLIGCLRRFVRRGKLRTMESYFTALDGLNTFHFRSYKSSQYNKMAEALYLKYFATAKERAAAES
jgi:DGQHR domain-containing protein